ncbi:MAG TPA: manganese efflux pump MntP family protein [Syntrophales bacterium]|nr:manganese efflux pump MntP family protein [Syntrophales bacterium]
MSFLSLLAVAVGLGTDAFSVALGVGGSIRPVSWAAVLRLSSFFGLFQLVMPVLGWLAGVSVTTVVAGFGHWIAFGLLVLVGSKMIASSFNGKEKIRSVDPTKGLSVVILSIATSVDALTVGVSFAFLKIPVLYPSVVIGAVAFLMTACGMVFGERMGKIAGRRAEVIGGILLIGIGIKILIGQTA